MASNSVFDDSMEDFEVPRPRKRIMKEEGPRCALSPRKPCKKPKLCFDDMQDEQENGARGNRRDVGVQIGLSTSSYGTRSGGSVTADLTHAELVRQIFVCKDFTIDWLMCLGLLARTRFCPGSKDGKQSCGKEMRLVPVPSGKTCSDGRWWKCRTHSRVLSLRHGSWFSNSNLTLEEIVEVTYFWCLGLTQAQVATQVRGLSSNTLVDWFNFCREVCEHTMIRETESGVMIGGPGVVVEIDESKFAKRKYHRGHDTKLGWVFGGREQEDKSKCFMVPVPDRSSATLVPLIRKHIAPGSIIHSDMWKAYDCLSNYGYVHKTVNHSEEFKSKEGVHTNGIEGDWQKAKHGMQMPSFGVKSEHLSSYLGVFLWRRKHGMKPNLFPEFLDAIRKLYGGNCESPACEFCT